MGEEKQKIFTLSAGVIALVLTLGVFFTLISPKPMVPAPTKKVGVAPTPKNMASTGENTSQQTVSAPDENGVKAVVEVKTGKK